MQHDESASSTQASTTQKISTRGDEDDFKVKKNHAASSDSENEQEVLDDDEARALPLDSFDKFGRGFVQSLVITVEDVGANDNHRQKFLDVTEDCFTHIIRLSNALTGCQGSVSSLHNSFVS